MNELSRFIGGCCYGWPSNSFRAVVDVQRRLASFLDAQLSISGVSLANAAYFGDERLLSRPVARARKNARMRRIIGTSYVEGAKDVETNVSHSGDVKMQYNPVTAILSADATS
jgi:hypothetical protein